MANLYGRLMSDRGKTTRTRTGNRYIASMVETWKGIVEVELWHDGRCEINLMDKNRNRRGRLWAGNIDEQARPGARQVIRCFRCGEFTDLLADDNEAHQLISDGSGDWATDKGTIIGYWCPGAVARGILPGEVRVQSEADQEDDTP